MNNQFTWLHIGLGSFHRAHQAWYLHRLMASGDKRWRIAAGNIRNDAEQVVQALAAQGGRYVLETVSPEGEREYEEITSIQKLLPWQAGLQPLINEGANPQTKVIAFTVTEGGYYLNTRHQLETSNITPRPAADLPARIKAQTGIDDKAPVMGETFIQWVVENNFRDARPNLEAVGVEMVESVIPYEEAKIRILNASHSCIAWAGTLIGQQYIHESTLTDAIYAIADRYVTEDVIPCLGDNGIDLPTYRDVVLKRFTNPHIQDTNQRVAADGFSKIPAMIAPTLQECYQRGVRPEATAMLPALFFVFMEQWHKGTLPYQYQDGILDEQAVHEMYEAQDPVAVFARDKALFGDLADNADFLALMREKVAAVYTLIK